MHERRKMKTEDEQKAEIVPETVKELVPSMNVGAIQKPAQEETAIVSDAELIGMYGQIMSDIKETTKQVDEILVNFVDMVVNQGDASTSSKEALVNLLKIKADQSDKMTKVADLMTRVKLKDKDTFPRYLAASQTNTINIGGGSHKKAILEAIKKAKNKETTDEQI